MRARTPYPPMRRPVTSTRLMRSIRPEPPTKCEATQLVRLTMIAPNVADHRPATWKPETSQATSANEMPFTTRRSEEHTSELQSQSNLVCRLLLEKKKKSYRTACPYSSL